MGIGISTDEYGNRPSRVLTLDSTESWKAHFDSAKETNKLLVIDFTATWCGPCKRMSPIIEDFAAKYTDVKFIKIDVDKLEDVAMEFGIQAMPTFLLLKEGKQLDKVVGADKDELKNKIEKHRA